LLPLVSSLRFSVWSLAPFFLFDEIDADLDATYRKALAKVIKECNYGRRRLQVQQGAGSVCCAIYHDDVRQFVFAGDIQPHVFLRLLPLLSEWTA
jgi:hypothetical protein